MQFSTSPDRVKALKAGTYKYVAMKYNNSNSTQSWIVGKKTCSVNDTIITADSSGQQYLSGVVWI